MATPIQIDPKCLALLNRAAALGLSDSKIQAASGLPGNWLAKARRGERSPDAPGWVLLRSWLDRFEAQAQTRPAPPSASKPPKAVAAPAPEEAEEVRSELADLVRGATTHRRIGKALERIALELVLGKLEARLAAGLESILETRAKSLRDERVERGMAKVAALRILLPSELALLERRRAAVALPPLAPGEKPLPPDEAPERIVADCPTCAGSSVLVVVRPRPPAPTVAPAGPLS